MIDPVSIGAGAIAKLAFDEFAKAGASEAAKAAVAGVVELVKGLRDRFVHRLLQEHFAQMELPSR